MKRFCSAVLCLVFIFAISGTIQSANVLYEAAKVGYSLPETTDFNNSLKMDRIESQTMGRDPIRKVVLDAGHGGKDGGCSGKHSNEKDIALDITLRLGQLIKKNHPDVEVIYTRDRDVFVPLHERADIANRNQADLFISIHCNTSGKRNSAMGTETFVLGLHRAEDNLDVAKRENSVIVHEDNYEEFYGGYDPNSDEGHITLSMYQNAYLDQSIALANMVEQEFEKNGQRVSRGVKQAGFLVLRNTVMPSVLIEAGFLNHNKEEMFLDSEEGKTIMAESIFNAFDQYKEEQDHLLANTSSEEKVEAIPGKTEEQKLETSTIVASNDKEEKINYVERAKREIEKLKQRNQQKESDGKAIQTSEPSSEEKVVNEKPQKIADVERTTPTAQDHSDRENRSQIVPREKTLEYVVQLSASKTKFTRGGGKWDQVKDVMIRKEGEMYKYQIGDLSSYDQAVKRKDELRKIGFADCFVVAYYNDDPITVKEALRMGL